MYNTVGETAGVTQDVGSDPTVGEFSDHCDDDDDDVGDDSELFYCTYCGKDLQLEEEGYVQLRVGREEGVERERETGPNVNVFDLSEMSRMEEEEDADEYMDEEPDNGFMDLGDEREDMSDGGRETLHDAPLPERKTS